MLHPTWFPRPAHAFSMNYANPTLMPLQYISVTSRSAA